MTRRNGGVQIEGSYSAGVIGDNNTVTITPAAPSVRTLIHLPRAELHQRRERAVSEWRRLRWRQFLSWQSAAFFCCILLFLIAGANMLLHELLAMRPPADVIRSIFALEPAQWLWQTSRIASPWVILVCAFAGVCLLGYLARRQRIYCRGQMAHLTSEIGDIDAALRQQV